MICIRTNPFGNSPPLYFLGLPKGSSVPSLSSPPPPPPPPSAAETCLPKSCTREGTAKSHTQGQRQPMLSGGCRLDCSRGMHSGSGVAQRRPPHRVTPHPSVPLFDRLAPLGLPWSLTRRGCVLRAERVPTCAAMNSGPIVGPRGGGGITFHWAEGGSLPLEPLPPRSKSRKNWVLGTFLALCQFFPLHLRCTYSRVGSLIIPLISLHPCVANIMSQCPINTFFGTSSNCATAQNTTTL